MWSSGVKELGQLGNIYIPLTKRGFPHWPGHHTPPPQLQSPAGFSPWAEVTYLSGLRTPVILLLLKVNVADTLADWNRQEKETWASPWWLSREGRGGEPAEGAQWTAMEKEIRQLDCSLPQHSLLCSVNDWIWMWTVLLDIAKDNSS